MAHIVHRAQKRSIILKKHAHHTVLLNFSQSPPNEVKGSFDFGSIVTIIVFPDLKSARIFRQLILLAEMTF